jgi:hypothetical protein
MDHIRATWTEIEIAGNLLLLFDEIRRFDSEVDANDVADILTARLNAVARACLPRLEATRPGQMPALHELVAAVETTIAALNAHGLSDETVRQALDVAELDALMLIRSPT